MQCIHNTVKALVPNQRQRSDVVNYPEFVSCLFAQRLSGSEGRTRRRYCTERMLITEAPPQLTHHTAGRPQHGRPTAGRPQHGRHAEGKGSRLSNSKRCCCYKITLKLTINKKFSTGENAEYIFEDTGVNYYTFL